jgi:hypothetical protein
MDFNAGATQQMGADGCFNATHPNNAGLSTMCVLYLHCFDYIIQSIDLSLFLSLAGAITAF